MKQLQQLFIVALLLSVNALLAQNKVALHSNGVSSFFTGANPFQEAYTAAVDGDTIYLPGGTYALPDNIDKHIVVYGSGHHPDYTAVMGKTILTGYINLYSGAAKSHFEGLSFTRLYYGAVADSVVVKRCKLTSVDFGGHASVGTQIIENVIEGIAGTGSVNTVIANNIIKKDGYDVIYNFNNNAWIHNNIIVAKGHSVNYRNYYMLSNITNCLFDNNIIFNEGNRVDNVLRDNVLNNTFKNNVFNGNPNLSLNTGENNFFGVASNSFFTNYTGIVFNYEEDFHLLNPASYIGTTGNEVGIYGGFAPAKVGMIPTNPHIQLKDIAPATDANGDLQIQIQVEAQNQ
ncbi:hypothetical protein [Gelatiniphilus marinus]|uniref:Right handed beta helix domain-containing protein n=1 Tax=Gelatiniphilus marinus TaxID=1759464 RepID=A0ABW5JTS1_9FLAO